MGPKVSKWLACITILMAVVAGIVWLNNIVVALQWSPSDGHNAEYYGFGSWLDSFAVDCSTVSTLIPFLGLILISRGFLQITIAKKRSVISEYFPFFQSYNEITIALGLIGTVWGLIMIGYYEPQNLGMTELLKCLRTALYSTLVALIWVFLIVKPIRYLMQRLYYQLAGSIESQIPETFLQSFNELATSSSGLSKRLNLVNSELLKLNENTAVVRVRLVKAAESLEQFKKLGETTLSGLASLVEQMNAESLKRADKIERERNDMKQLMKQYESILQHYKEELDRVNQEKQGAIKQTVETMKRLTGAEKKIGHYEKQFEKVKELVNA